MKKCFLFIPAGAILFSLLTGCSSAKNHPESSAENPVSSEPESKTENTAGAIKFDFENGDEAFVSIFADYPCGEGAEEFYELKHSLEDNPVKGNGKSLFISGNNHSDDLFMGYYKRLDGFEAGEKYVFSVKFEIATDVSGNMMGVGGAPGESVFVKCGLTSAEPKKVIKDDANYRLNIDAGVQGNGGKDMIVVGNIAKQDEQNFNGYDINRYELDFSAITDKNGSVYLVIGTDSGFEATTHYFIDNIELSWKKSE